MGWASFLEDLEKVRDDLRHLGEAVRTKIAARPNVEQARVVPTGTPEERGHGSRTRASDGLQVELAGLSASLVELERRLDVLLDTATDPAIGIAIEVERALTAAAKEKEQTKLIAQKALRKSVARREAAAALEREAAQIKLENVELKAELAKLKISGEGNQFERENNVLKSRIRELRDLLGARARNSRH